ncbi:hypothetical protein R0381_001911 [Jeongeupia wiesaeckerbachi]|uniref:hypothetical protein n=1 Tax=Jeongeupia wiesaeckerbachi TaxID=3051218 RepID=UPI003D8016BA
MRVHLLPLLLLCLALAGRGLPLVHAATPTLCSAAGSVPAGVIADCHDASCCVMVSLPAAQPVLVADPLPAIEIATVGRPGCGTAAPASRARDPPGRAMCRTLSL